METNLLSHVKTIAIVGLSDKPERESYQVAEYLLSQGFTIIPVNPNITEVLGQKTYPSIAAIPETLHIDVVDIFRRSEEVLPHVAEAVKRNDCQTIWMQEGISNDEAKELAESHGRTVIMNFCLMKTHKQTNKSQDMM